MARGEGGEVASYFCAEQCLPQHPAPWHLISASLAAGAQNNQKCVLEQTVAGTVILLQGVCYSAFSAHRGPVFRRGSIPFEDCPAGLALLP